MGKRARRPAAAADKGDNRAVSPAALADFSDRAADKGNNRARPPAALADFSSAIDFGGGAMLTGGECLPNSNLDRIRLLDNHRR